MSTKKTNQRKQLIALLEGLGVVPARPIDDVLGEDLDYFARVGTQFQQLAQIAYDVATKIKEEDEQGRQDSERTEVGDSTGDRESADT